MASMKVPFTSEKPISQKFYTASIAQIPAYEDSGVKFQGKYKNQVSANNYELKGQYKLIKTVQLEHGVKESDHFLFNGTRKFQLTGMLIQWSLTAVDNTKEFALGEWSAALGGSLSLNKNFRFRYGIHTSGNLFFDFSSAPVEFAGLGWGYTLFPSLNAGEWVNVFFIGFEEQI